MATEQVNVTLPEGNCYCLLPQGVSSANGASLPIPQRPADAELMRRNAVWFCQLRWIVVTILATAGVLGWFPDVLQYWGLRVSPGWALATAGALIVLNSFYLALLPKETRDDKLVLVQSNLWMQIVADLVVLTIVIHFLGSLETYAMFMYLFHVIFACIFFPRIQALVVTLGAVALYLTCLAFEATGWLTPQTVLMDTGTLGRARVSSEVWAMQIGSAFLIWAGIWYLASRQAGELRQRERDLAMANYRLHAGIEERSRHMLQTTHQLKAPFAAVHANTQLLLGGYCGDLPDSATGIVERISSRCAVLSQQILEMLQLANLRSTAQARPEPKDIALDQMLKSAISRVEPTATSRDIQIRSTFQPIHVAGDQDHLWMIIDNLLANAVNYSYDGGTVEVECRRNGKGEALVVVSDHGIGIPPDKLPLVFDDYYRTNEASLHNKASTGLGLAIVRDVARMWSIRVDVQSAPERGTHFTLTLPAGQPDVACAEL